ncbi:MAG: CPBP family intramembrane metalloprotease [Ruminococcaceae bacterium]|nr:CPBP family intramembrane metalloprotease [Oscillospiraceae bacterium]
MKRRINSLVTVDLAFLFILAAAGSAADERIGNIIYYLAFIIPITIGIIYMRSFDCELYSDSEDRSGDIPPLGISITARNALITLPIIAPTVAVICLISYLTGIVMSALGYVEPFVPEESFLYSVLMHALIPSVLEEMLFRYIPLGILRRNKKAAILISAVLFSLAHASLFQIPYAFAAGIVLASVSVMSGSIIPAIVIHFVNNLISLALSYGIGGAIFPSVCAVIAILSLIPIIIFRKTYIGVIKELFTGDRIKIERSIIIYGGLSLFLAVSALFL